MDHSMRMVIIAGVLMLALLIAIVGSVGADAPMWTSTASPAYPINPADLGQLRRVSAISR